MKWVVLLCGISILVGALEGESVEEHASLQAHWKLTPSLVQEGEWLTLEGEVTFPDDLDWDWGSFLEELTKSLDPLSPRWYIRDALLEKPAPQEMHKQKRAFSLQILANGNAPHTLFGLQMRFFSSDRQTFLPIQIVEVPLEPKVPPPIEAEPLLPLLPQTFFQVFHEDALSPPSEELGEYLAKRTIPWIWVSIASLLFFAGIAWKNRWKQAWKEWVAYERKERETLQLQHMLGHLQNAQTTTEEFYTTCKYVIRKSSARSLDLEKKIDYILFGHTIPSESERAADLRAIQVLFEER